MKIFEVQGLTKKFGGLTAVDDVSFFVEKGKIKGIIGPNGAGKTSIFNLISGFYPFSSGEILFKGIKLGGLKAHKIASLGISRTFQNLQVFENMTVVENVMMGFHCRAKAGIFAALVRSPVSRKEDRWILEKSLEKLAVVGLEAKAYESSENLSYGEQKFLELARVLASDPEIILLDEPASGLNSEEIRGLSSLIESIQGQGVSILLVEHNMKFIMNICHDILVLNYGKVIADCCPEEVQSNQEVVKAYLGEGADFAECK